MNEDLVLSCVGLDDLGRGVCRYNNGTYLIEGMLPNEEASVIIDYSNKRNSLYFGHIKRNIKKSQYRVEPSCKAYPFCGCSLTHLKYEESLKYKQMVIQNLLHKIGHLNIEVKPTIPCKQLKWFRNKVQKPIGYNNGKLACGFFKPNSHIISFSQSCESESILSSKITKVLMVLLNEYGYSAYDEDKNVGQIRHILIKTSLKYNEALVTLVSTTLNLKDIKELAKELMFKVKEVKGFILNINDKKTNVILGEKEELVLGDDHIKENILGYDFMISSKSFFQTNSYLIDTLYSKGIELLDFKGDERVLDAYCGTGTIGMCLSKYVKNVTGVELEKSSFEDAKKNAKLNGIKNIFFRNEDATTFMEKTNAKFDVIVLDPPRKGTTKQFINALFRIKPKKVLYISCDPATLARDLALFSKEYEIKYVQGVDMFPTNYHIETLALLVRK